MNIIATDFGNRMATLGLGNVTGANVNIFNQNMPSQPDNAMVIRELPGSGPVRAMGARQSPPVLDRPSVQILIRNLRLVDLGTKVVAVRDAWDWWDGTINGHVYKLVQLAYEPTYIGQDEHNRYQASVVLRVDMTR